MAKFDTIKSALNLFEKEAITYGEYTEKGDYKKTNKSHSVIVEAATYLHKKGVLGDLAGFLHNTNSSVRAWAAVYLLDIEKIKAQKALEDISEGNDMIAIFAKNLLDLFNKGDLKIYYKR